jgi:hypothetical protein
MISLPPLGLVVVVASSIRPTGQSLTHEDDDESNTKFPVQAVHSVAEGPLQKAHESSQALHSEFVELP